MLDAGLAEILQPLVGDVGYGDAIHGFSGLNAEIAGKLLEPLGEEYLAKERQNDGPSMGSVLQAVLDHPDSVRAHGYLVGPGRCDERVTVEGVIFRVDRDYRLCSLYEDRRADCECELLFAWLRDALQLDSRRPPTELTACFGATDASSGPWYRAWWT